ncbi:MAG: hypothetical protein LUC43_02045 [Burkholderiales bacterium]|nr:hypothetical protein [Burkholderiales bacterium]
MNLKAIATVALPCFLLVACATNQNDMGIDPGETYANAANTGSRQMASGRLVLEDTSIPKLTIIYTNEDVARAVGVINARVQQMGGLERLTGSIKNLSTTQFPIEYQVTWTDAYDGALNSSSPWIRVTLPGRGKKPFSIIGKDPHAALATMTIRVPTDVEIIVPGPDPEEAMQYQQIYNQRLGGYQE